MFLLQVSGYSSTILNKPPDIATLFLVASVKYNKAMIFRTLF